MAQWHGAVPDNVQAACLDGQGQLRGARLKGHRPSAGAECVVVSGESRAVLPDLNNASPTAAARAALMSFARYAAEYSSGAFIVSTASFSTASTAATRRARSVGCFNLDGLCFFGADHADNFHRSTLAPCSLWTAADRTCENACC